MTNKQAAKKMIGLAERLQNTHYKFRNTYLCWLCNWLGDEFIPLQRLIMKIINEMNGYGPFSMTSYMPDVENSYQFYKVRKELLETIIHELKQVK